MKHIHCKCKNPNCGKYDNHVVKYHEPEDNPPHAHMECIHCGRNFNLWLCNEDIIKKTFGSIYKEYL